MTTRRSSEPLQLFLADVVRLRKPHPCGSHDWTVVRLGADIGLRCLGCSRRVLLPRRELERRLKQFVSRGPDFVSVGGEALSGNSERANAEGSMVNVASFPE